jgi:hypothetical protein
MDFALSANPPSTRPMLTRRAPVMQFSVELLTPTHYARLGLAEDADAAAVEDAWQRLRPPAVRDVAPDEAGASLKAVAWPQPGLSDTPVVRSRQREVAYTVLSDPGRRAVYDRWLAEHRGRITRPPDTPRWQAWLHSHRGHWQIGLGMALLTVTALAWLAL